jgi:hypothetical protein
MGGKMDEFRRRADGNEGYGRIVEEFVDEEGQREVGSWRDFIAKCNGRQGGGGGGSVADRREHRNINPRGIGLPSSKKVSWLAGDR